MRMMIMALTLMIGCDAKETKNDKPADKKNEMVIDSTKANSVGNTEAKTTANTETTPAATAGDVEKVETENNTNKKETTNDQ